MNTPRIYTPETLSTLEVRAQVADRWVLARPLGWGGLMLLHRLRCAWLVFTAKADVLRWEDQP